MHEPAHKPQQYLTLTHYTAGNAPVFAKYIEQIFGFVALHSILLVLSCNLIFAV